MLKSIVEQATTLMFGIFCGMVIGFLYDLYRLFRGLKVARFVIFVEDILFWIFSAIVIFMIMYYTSAAYIGTYAYLYICIGLFIYFKLLSYRLIKIEKLTLKLLFSIVRILFKHLLYPFLLILNKITRKT
ncbi:MAG TPA: spore cortex biosynthesis protein YabQ [Clostridiaceae bacterium]